MRTRLLTQAKHLRQNQEKVEKQLTYLNTEIQHTKLTRRAAELVIALVAGGIVTLIMGRLIGLGLSKVQLSTDSENIHPASIPYINTKEDCDRRDGSIWYEGKCWDFTHGVDW